MSLYDPMTEEIYNEVLNCFRSLHPKVDWKTIDILNGGESALQQANVDFGELSTIP